ncbi:MAG TPA: YcxB family protein [Novosphingobium sp.]|nr:YcxB family protein [Novosphingobium sp.]
MRDEINVTLWEADLIEAYRPIPRRQRLSILILLLATTLALLIVGLLIRFPAARESLVTSPLAMGLVGAIMLAVTLVVALLIVAPALRRRAARNTLETHPGMRDPISYSFDSEHFAVRSTYTRADYPWTQLWDWRETDSVLIVLPTPRNFYLVPKRDVPPEVLARLRERLGQVRKRAGSAPPF